MSYIEKIIEIDDQAYTILIGRNAKGNDLIIRNSHPESISSAHIILQSKGEPISKKYLICISKT